MSRLRVKFFPVASIVVALVLLLGIAVVVRAPAPPARVRLLATIFPSITPPPTATVLASSTPLPLTAPTMSAPTMSAPTMSAPTMSAPTMSAPTMSALATPEPTLTSALIMLAPAPMSAPVVAPPTAAPAPVAAARLVSSGCPASGASFATLDVIGVYKGNHLTDENADLRLSVLGLAEVVETPALVGYNGATDPAAPKLSGLLVSNAGGVIVRTYRRYDWLWNEGGGPPYGGRAGVNVDWPVTAIELAAQPGEAVLAPSRPADIGGGFAALVLYAGEEELTLAYGRQDGVTDAYVVHLRGLCVDPGLTAAYRAQMSGGLRATGRLPALRSSERVGTMLGGGLIVAVRDRGAFMDPRSRKDWW